MKKLIILIISNLLIANVTSDAAISIDSDVTVTINGNFSNSGNVGNEGSLNINGYYDHNAGAGTFSGSGTFSLCDQPKTLDDGANLISFYALPEDASISNVMSSLGLNATGVIGAGEAASNHPTLGWIGSLIELEGDKGYWVITNEAFSFSFDLSGLVTDE